MHTDLELLSRLTEILSDVTGAPVKQLGRESTPETTPGWDSLANLAFIAGIEQELDVSISTSDILRIRSVGDLVAHLRPVLAARGQMPETDARERG